MLVDQELEDDVAKAPAHDHSETKLRAISTQDLVDDNEVPESFGSILKSLWPRHPDLDAVATKRSVFDDEELRKFYAPPADYENAHRFDPNERWTYREERAVLRKIDFHILLWVLVSCYKPARCRRAVDSLNR